MLLVPSYTGTEVSLEDPHWEKKQTEYSKRALNQIKPKNTTY